MLLSRRSAHTARRGGRVELFEDSYRRGLFSGLCPRLSLLQYNLAALIATFTCSLPPSDHHMVTAHGARRAV